MQDRAVRIGSENDVSKFFGLHQSTLRADGIGELLALRNRLATNLASGVHVVLSLDCFNHIRCCDAELGEFVGINPYPQRILAAKNLYTRHAFYASQLVLKIDDGVIGEKVLAQLAGRAS